MVLFVLGIAWVALIASWLRGRAQSRNVNSISSFNKHLSVLERTSPARQGFSTVTVRPGRSSGPVPEDPYVAELDEVLGAPPAARRAPLALAPPPGPAMSLPAARRRRRDVVFGLVIAAAATGALTLLVGKVALVLFAAVVGLLLVYMAMLVRAQRLGVERRAKVRYLPTGDTDSQPEPVLLLQRSAN